MAGPPNPFAGLAQTQAQRNGQTAGRGGRGGTAFGQPTPFQAKNSSANSHQSSGSAPRDSTRPTSRGRGRGGASLNPRSARGRGAGIVNTSRNKNESTTNSASPFAQLKPNNNNNKPSRSSPSPSPFGQAPQVSQRQSPFSSTGAAAGSGPFGPTGFGASSSVVDSSRDPRKKPAPTSNGAMGSNVPVEDSSALGSYTERYEKLKIARAKEREMAIKKGLMADPNQPTSLHQAITPVGTCTSMCPEFERVERIVQKMVDKSEKYLHSSTNSLQYMETKMLKRFRRSAAGYDEQLPSDIRTPNTLLQTMNYLIRHAIGGPEPLGLIHKFVWDRTRSIRNDFSVQQVTQENDVRIAVTCLERIARFHIVSLHLLSSPANEEPFDRHQEREQLNNTMLSLMYYYDDNRGRISFPNEDEFRAYYIIFSIHDQRPDLEARVQKWPAELRNSTRVQAALELFAASGNTWDYQGTLDSRRPNAIAQGFYTRFFELVNSPCVSYLMACVAEIYFNHVRQTAIRSIWKGYCRYPMSQQHKNEEWTIDELTTVLCFDDNDQTIQFCEEQDLTLDENSNGDLYLNWGSRPVDSIAFQPSSEHSFSETCVEVKRAGRSLVAIILGLSVREAASLGMIDSSVLPERSLALPAPKHDVSKDNDDSLFVSDDENEIPAPTVQMDEQPLDAINDDNPPEPASIFQTGFAQQTGNALTSGLSAEAPAFQPSKPFSSPFGGNLGGTPAAPPSAAPNPFGSISPFAPSQATPATQPATQSFGPFSQGPETSNPTFDTAPTAAAPSVNQNETNNAAPPSTTPQFKFPSVSQPLTSSPFGVPSTSTPPNPFNKPAEGTTDQPAKNLFDSVKPPAFPASTGSLFSFSSQNTPPKEQDAQATPKDPSTGGFSLFAPKTNETTPSIFSTTPTTTPSSSIFAPKDTTTQSAEPEKKDQAAVKPTEVEEKPVASESEPEPENQPEPEPEHEPPTSADDAKPEPEAEASPETEAPTGLELAVQEPANEPEDAAATSEPAAGEELLTDANQNRVSWLEALKQTAIKRREEQSAGRKRVHDEPEERRPAESSDKGPKKPKAEAPIPRKKSMALSSIKPLPTLPILEQVKSSTKRKSSEELTPEPPKPKYNQVDEDELLLSAARIAAESLRSGPRLSDGWAGHTTDLARSSFSPASSLSPSLAPLSGSVSPQPHVNGHDLALAPDTDLGLGRTLSRTEQRLRLTGGKGLAYKPLDFTPEKKRKSLRDSR